MLAGAQKLSLHPCPSRRMVLDPLHQDTRVIPRACSLSFFSKSILLLCVTLCDKKTNRVEVYHFFFFRSSNEEPSLYIPNPKTDVPTEQSGSGQYVPKNKPVGPGTKKKSRLFTKLEKNGTFRDDCGF